MTRRKQENDEDPWAGWQPQWPQQQTPHDIQERHSPTQDACVRLEADNIPARSRRRILDARLWEAMNGAQQQAALEITRAYEALARGLGYTVSDWERLPGTANTLTPAEIHRRMIGNYNDWTALCRRERLSHSMIVDVLVFGVTCRALDRDRRVKKGACRENLMAGLNLYAKLRGWRP